MKTTVVSTDRCKHPGCCNQYLQKVVGFHVGTKKRTCAAEVEVRSGRPLVFAAYTFEGLRKAGVDTGLAVDFAASSSLGNIVAGGKDASACHLGLH